MSLTNEDKITPAPTANADGDNVAKLATTVNKLVDSTIENSQSTAQTSEALNLAQTNVAKLNEFAGQGAKYSPDLFVDFTGPNAPEFAIVSGTPAIAEIAVNPENGKRGLHIVADVGTVSVQLSQLAGVKFNNQAYLMTSYDTERTTSQNISMRFYSADGVFGNYQNYLVASVNGGDVPGGNVIRTFNLSHVSWQGTARDYPITIFECRILISGTVDAPIDTWIYGVGLGSPRKGRVCVVWDDGRDSSLTLGAPVFRAAGITKQTLSLIQGRLGQVNGATEGMCRAFVNSGGAVVPHSPHGPNIVDQFPGDPAAAVAAIKENIEYIRSSGLATPRFDRCFVYPQGKYQAAQYDISYLQAMRAAGIDIARISFMQDIRQQRNIDSHSSTGRLACTTIGHQYMGASGATPEADNIAAVIQRINDVSTYGLDCFLMLHSVVKADGQEADPYDISVPNLELIAAAIKTNIDAGKLEAVTMPELVIDGDNYWNSF